jgi:para-aminobenzoate synthetase component I
VFRHAGGRSEMLDAVSGTAIATDAALRGDPLADLAAAVKAMPGHIDEGGRFGGGWIGYASYDLGRVIEPKAQRGGRHQDEWPLIEFQYCPAGYIVDHASGTLEWRGGSGDSAPVQTGAQGHMTYHCGEIQRTISAEVFQSAVARAVEYIHAGDVFQVNLAHQLRASFRGSTRGAFITLRQRARPWYGMYLELAPAGRGRRAILSMSPESFLEISAEQDGVRLTTRPMKGTRPAGADPAELRSSIKDRAELDMIIDLMRNDLGRVCRFGTVRVPEARQIENHGSVLQATATVTGVLRPGLGLAEILRAMFPPGSVTGAPKIRAMQIIDELEPAQRGPYCGMAGWIAGGERASFNVAIRTALVRGEETGDRDHVERGELLYSVGAGIVADSTPEGEWQETLDKAGVLKSEE